MSQPEKVFSVRSLLYMGSKNTKTKYTLIDTENRVVSARGGAGVGGEVGELGVFNLNKLNKNRTGESSQRFKAEDFQQEDEDSCNLERSQVVGLFPEVSRDVLVESRGTAVWGSSPCSAQTPRAPAGQTPSTPPRGASVLHLSLL